MGRAPCCEKVGLKRGPWTRDEDQLLINFINENGHGNWRALPKKAGLLRCGKSCRLRWTNYLRPDIKRGNFTKEEEDTIIQLHQQLGNKWSEIASRLPGRTDNEIKNVWHTHLKKRLVDAPPETKKRTRRRSNKKANLDEEGSKDAAETPRNSAATNESGDSTTVTSSMGEANSPSQTTTTTSTEVSNTALQSDAATDGDSLDKLLDIDDDFWSDVISGDYSSIINNNTTDSTAIEPQQYPFQSTMDVFDFDPNTQQQDHMDFWCDFFTRDGELHELLQL